MCLFSEGSRPSAWGSLLISPIGLRGLDDVGGEDLGGFEFDDGDGGFVGDGEDSFAGVGDADADAEVVHAAGSTEAHRAGAVEAVVTQSVVPWAWVAGGLSFGESRVGRCGGTPAEFSVRSVVLVKVPETVELGLEVDQIGPGGLLGQPLLEGLMEPFHFALGLRVAGWRGGRSSVGSRAWPGGIRRRSFRHRSGRCTPCRCRSMLRLGSHVLRW